MKNYKKRILIWIFTSFTSPFLLWFFLLWFLGLASITTLREILFNPFLYLGLITVSAITFRLLKGKISIIDDNIKSPAKENLELIRSSISYVRKLAIAGIFLNLLVTPLVGILGVITDIRTMTTVYLIALFSFLLCSMPFALKVIQDLEEWTGQVELGKKPEFSVKNRILLIVLISIISVGMLVVLSVYALLTYNNNNHIQIIIHILVLAPIATTIIYFSFTSFLNSLLDQLKDATLIATEMKNGNLSEELNIIRRDEIGILGDGLNGIQHNLRSTIREVLTAINRLVIDIKKIAEITDNFSKSTHEQATLISTISATTEEVSSESNNIKDLAQGQAKVTMELEQNISRLFDIGKNTEKTMSEAMSVKKSMDTNTLTIKDNITNTLRMMKDAVESSDAAVNSVTMISDIAEQVSLLSLNAAIEAARSGEAGRGFAVVADQIGKLSDETTTNTKTINQQLEKNNQEIHNAMKSMSQTIEFIESYISSISLLGDKVEKVEKLAHEDMELNLLVQNRTKNFMSNAETIQTATAEQRNAMEDIINSIISVNDSIHSIASGSDEIITSLKNLSGLADNLKNNMDFFNLP